MLQPRQPGRNAQYIGTMDAGVEFGILDADMAIEPADTPGMVRVYRRTTPSAPWKQGSQMTASEAQRYGFTTRPDSSD